MHLLVNVDVDDLERAIVFYTAALGLRVARRLFDGSVALDPARTAIEDCTDRPSRGAQRGLNVRGSL
jgi:catechol 2,3-dioxygenase-like lactoylglutathione lyase family enzyme